MENVLWLFGGLVVGILFVRSLLPGAIQSFIKVNSGKTFVEKIDGDIYTIKIEKYKAKEIIK